MCSSIQERYVDLLHIDRIITLLRRVAKNVKFRGTKGPYEQRMLEVLNDSFVKNSIQPYGPGAVFKLNNDLFHGNQVNATPDAVLYNVGNELVSIAEFKNLKVNETKPTHDHRRQLQLALRACGVAYGFLVFCYTGTDNSI